LSCLGTEYVPRGRELALLLLVLIAKSIFGNYERVSTYNENMDNSTHFVLELLQSYNETFGSRASFGIVEPILDIHANSRSVL
jgi:hypothetical protein